MQIGFHHFQKRKSKESTKKQEGLNKLVDELIYVIGSLGVLIFIPQLITVWTAKDISGVSLLSWSGMFLASSFWFFYGMVHKARPIIFINILAATIQLLVVIGIILHK